jgi:hypothetical protein
MIKKILVIFIFLVLFLVTLSPVAAQSQATISISNSSAQMDFPLNLNFSSQIKSNTNITDIRLRYQIQQMSFAKITSEVYVVFSPSTTVNAKYTLDMRKTGGLPPGSNLTYWWTVKNASGATEESEPVQFQVNDNRYKWRNLSQGKISLFWYQGNDAFAQALMSTAQSSLAKLAQDTGASPDQTINIYIYNGSKDLQGSMIYPQEWTGGVAFTQYNIVAIGISPDNLVWGQGAMTHELTHVVISQMTFSPYADLPVWLNEGLAMYSEGALGPQYTSPLKNAISSSSLISARSISSPFSSNTNKSLLSYAESFGLVEYLVSQYGSNKMLQLLSTFKQGSTYDDAFKTVYGFDMDVLNNQWKNWITSKYGK